MTNPTPHGQVPEALIDLIDAYTETRHRCGGIYNARTEAARKAVIEALSGVQALSAAPGVTSEQRRLIGVIADKIEDGTLFQSGIYQKKDLARFVRNMLDTTPTAPAASPTPPALSAAPAIGDELRDTLVSVSAAIAERDDRAAQKMIGEILAASPTPPAEARRRYDAAMEQAAPKAAPGEQNTVPAELLEQAYREGWAACRDAETIGEEAEDWAFWNSTANSRMIDAQQAAPQQEAQEPVAWQGVHDQTDLYYTKPLQADVRPLYAAPQPAPAPLSDDAKDAARYRWLREGNDAKHGAAWHVAVNLYGCEWDAAIDAAIAAHGGNKL